MTLPDGEKVLTNLERWQSRIMPLSALGTCLCLMGYAALQVQVSADAAAGQRARDIQIQREAALMKMATAAERSGWITQADLACFRDPPRKCPPVKTP